LFAIPVVSGEIGGSLNKNKCENFLETFRAQGVLFLASMGCYGYKERLGVVYGSLKLLL
jgi:hypothetical protein